MTMLIAIQLIASILSYRPANLKEAEQRYGKLYSDYTWQNKGKHLVNLKLGKLNPHLDNVRINKDVIIPFMIVMVELKHEGLLGEITRYKGCYNPRAIEGTNRPSTHAYGLGCDFNNGPFTRDFIKVWKRNGFCWGGDFVNAKKDPMHFSYAWECSNNKR